MSNELVSQDKQDNPFQRALVAQSGGNVGSITIETERAVAEAQGQLTLAKKFPRSTVAAIAEFLESCKSTDFAATAFYSVPNRGTGPSIRFAEECARVYGNFQYGHRELSRTADRSEVEVFAWDMEKNNRSIRQITVNHVLDTKNGTRRLTDQADIDNKIANVASKQMRGRIMALMPKHMIAAGIAECKKTIAGGNEKPLSERITQMISVFAKFGVTAAMIAKHLGHAVDSTTTDEFADLLGIFNALKDGAKVAEYFPQDEVIDAAEKPAAKAIAEAAAAKKTPSAKVAPVAEKPVKATPKVEPEPDLVEAAAEPEPEPEAAPEQPEQSGEDEDVF